jgi:thiamine pyrophosphokinase
VLAPFVSVAVLLAPSRTVLSSSPGTRVSLLPLTGTAVVSLEGLEYPLHEEVLYADACRGVSNEVRRPGASVAVTEGEVLAVVAASGERFAVHGTRVA